MSSSGSFTFVSVQILKIEAPKLEFHKIIRFEYIYSLARSSNEECGSLLRYIPLPWADTKWTVRLQRVDNGPIEI